MEVEGTVGCLEAVLGARTHDEGLVGADHSLGWLTICLEGMLLSGES